jgi:hypothetical protein
MILARRLTEFQSARNLQPIIGRLPYRKTRDEAASKVGGPPGDR